MRLLIYSFSQKLTYLLHFCQLDIVQMFPIEIEIEIELNLLIGR